MKDTSVDLISVKGDYVLLDTYAAAIFTREQVMELSQMDTFYERNQNKVLQNVEEDRFGRTDEKMFSYLRKVSDEFGDYGYVSVQKTVSSISSFLETSTEKFDMISVVILNGELFYVTDENKNYWQEGIDILAREAEKEDVSEKCYEVTVNGEKYMLCAAKKDKYGIQVFTLLPHEYYASQILQEAFILFLQSMALMLSMIMLVTLVSKQIYKPVVDLRKKMENYEITGSIEDMKSLEKIDATDEIEAFNLVFANMIERIQIQNDEIAQRKIRELQVSYQALRAQVNPHFMHNILYLIGLKGVEHGAPEILDMCSNLTRMMSYCVDNKKEMVPFEEEIQYMNYYLELMKYRYMDKLQYEIHIEDQVKEVLVPKFILQPLVENCFTHGFKNSTVTTYLIHIYIKIEEDRWLLSIEDNGVGFSEDDKERVEKDLDYIKRSILESDGSFVNETSGIGLINTWARLYISYSERVSLKISSGIMGGGMIELGCPFERNAIKNE